jgi:hypothetical protein
MTSLFFSREYSLFLFIFHPFPHIFWRHRTYDPACREKIKINRVDDGANAVSTEPGPSVILQPMDDVYRLAERPGGDTLLLPTLPAAGHVLYHAGLDQEFASNAFSAQFPTLNVNSQPIPAPEQDFNIKPNSDAVSTGADATTMPADNQEQITALVNSREKEVTELQTTLAVPLAAFNAKFVWHCIMNIESDCEYVYFSF